MCGIAGMMTADGSPPPAAVLDRMLRALGHRGPDGEGRFVAPGVGLVQTRLAIIDLETGDQPLYGSDGTALVANGEIYNFIELKHKFADEAFSTRSDCELPLFTYKSDGDNFANSLRGMYAIALADRREHALCLARDPFGIKPLYFAEIPSGMLFASEPQALLKTDLVKREIRPEAAVELLQLQFTTGKSTIFPGITRVAPGETLVFRGAKVVGRALRRALPDGPPLPISEQEALKKLDDVLMDSVLVHQRSDVPYGMFLSGGVDSSILLACMARLNEKPVRAFTAGFPGTAARDEREYARAVAKAMGAEHIEVEVKESDFWNRLPAVAAAMDDPAGDYATIPSYLLAAEAAKELKVVLTGEGGDELFGGYGRYRTLLRSPWLGGRAMRQRGILDGLKVLRSSRHWRDGITAAERRLATSGESRLQQAQALDCAYWLPNDLLLKVDRCLMAYGLEGRTPFLDPVVADFAFRLPDGLKISKGRGKYLLRRWLEKALPAAKPFSPKRGFTVPVAEWIASRAKKLAPLLARSDGLKQLCHPDRVEKLFAAFGDRGGKHEGAACWQLLFYALWHGVHIEGRSAYADVFELLGGK
jgi:asparagine synthase (glutamine-hydrolysing)